jgi:hypothetical protein
MAEVKRPPVTTNGHNGRHRHVHHDDDAHDGSDDDDNNGSGSGSDSGSDDNDGHGEGDDSDTDTTPPNANVDGDVRAAAVSARERLEATNYSDGTPYIGDTIRDLWRLHSAASITYSSSQRRGCRSCLTDTFGSKAAPSVTLPIGPLHAPMIGMTLTQEMIIPPPIADPKGEIVGMLLNVQ